MGLFEALEHLEDPFVGFVILDGINAREEFEVLHWHQLMTARNFMFPDASPFSRPKERNDSTDGSIREEAVTETRDNAETASPNDIPVLPQSSFQDDEALSERKSKTRDFKRMSVHFKTLQLDDDFDV